MAIQHFIFGACPVNRGNTITTFGASLPGCGGAGKCASDSATVRPIRPRNSGRLIMGPCLSSVPGDTIGSLSVNSCVGRTLPRGKGLQQSIRDRTLAVDQSAPGFINPYRSGPWLNSAAADPSPSSGWTLPSGSTSWPVPGPGTSVTTCCATTASTPSTAAATADLAPPPAAVLDLGPGRRGDRHGRAAPLERHACRLGAWSAPGAYGRRLRNVLADVIGRTPHSPQVQARLRQRTPGPEDTPAISDQALAIGLILARAGMDRNDQSKGEQSEMGSFHDDVPCAISGVLKQPASGRHPA